MLKNDKGLTLIEVLGALLILSIVIITFVGVSQFTNLSFSRNDDRTEAIRLAEKTLSVKKNAIATAAIVPNSGTQGAVTTIIDNYSVTIYDTALTNSIYALPAGKTSHVSVQTIVILKSTVSPFADEPRLITVTVSWGG